MLLSCIKTLPQTCFKYEWAIFIVITPVANCYFAQTALLEISSLFMFVSLLIKFVTICTNTIVTLHLLLFLLGCWQKYVVFLVQYIH